MRTRIHIMPDRKGATLIELAVVMLIIGILAAVALPVVSGYIRDAKISEAGANIAGIFEAEEAFFVRFQRYTVNLGWCPPAAAANGQSQLWPGDVTNSCNGGQDLGAEWAMLGWRPDGAVYFQYRVWSAYGPDPATAQKIYHPLDNPPPGMVNTGKYAINWNMVDPSDYDAMLPWCAVEARADTDNDGTRVFFRGNSVNGKWYRDPADGW